MDDTYIKAFAIQGSHGPHTDPKISVGSVAGNTVKYHNRNIYRKLGVKSRQQVQTQAKKLGLYGGSI